MRALEALAGLCSLLACTGAALSAATWMQALGMCSMLLHAQARSLAASLGTYYRTPTGPTRRASEAYLLLQHLMHRCSAASSLPLTLALALGCAGLLHTLLHHHQHPLPTALLPGGASLLLLSWPLLLLSHANALVPLLRLALTHSGPGDYEAIGGRDKWLAYLRSNPAYW